MDWKFSGKFRINIFCHSCLYVYNMYLLTIKAYLPNTAYVLFHFKRTLTRKKYLKKEKKSTFVSTLVNTFRENETHFFDWLIHTDKKLPVSFLNFGLIRSLFYKECGIFVINVWFGLWKLSRVRTTFMHFFRAALRSFTVVQTIIMLSCFLYVK
jgi:hypothetical protein